MRCRSIKAWAVAALTAVLISVPPNTIVGYVADFGLVLSACRWCFELGKESAHV